MSISNWQKPDELWFQVPKMWHHLLSCLEEGFIQNFPSDQRHCHHPTHRIERIDVYCKCHHKEEGNMVSCDSCREWYHNTCEAIPKEAWTNHNFNWQCSHCEHYTAVHGRWIVYSNLQPYNYRILNMIESLLLNAIHWHYFELHH